MERWTMEQTLTRAPVLMLPAERLLLYALVQALRPKRCVEIGTHKGGSALIIGAALDQVGDGTLVCIDPTPLVSEEHWQRIAHRATLLTGASPGVLAEATRVAGGPFDFALIDGDHSYDGVLRDLDGVVPVLTDDAFLLFHDAHFPEVAAAIDASLDAYAGAMTDAGMLSVDRSFDEDGRVWGGLRLVRFSRGEHRPAFASSGNGTHAVAATTAAGGARPADFVERLREAWSESDDGLFVARVFRILLGRDIDGAGSDVFVAALAAGVPRLAVVNEIARSREAAEKRLPVGWLADLALEFGAGPAPRPPIVQRVMRSAQRATRLPWMIEQMQTLGSAHQQRLDAQQDMLNEVRSQLEAVARDVRTMLVARRAR